MTNKVILTGNIGKEPEVKRTANGMVIANLTLATTESYKDKAGQKQTKTEWHKLVAYGNLAEIIEKYVHKGDKLLIMGKLQYRTWDKDDGTKSYITEIVINEMEMLGGKQQGKSQEKNDGWESYSKDDNLDDKIPFS